MWLVPPSDRYASSTIAATSPLVHAHLHPIDDGVDGEVREPGGHLHPLDLLR